MNCFWQVGELALFCGWRYAAVGGNTTRVSGWRRHSVIPYDSARKGTFIIAVDAMISGGARDQSLYMGIIFCSQAILQKRDAHCGGRVARRIRLFAAGSPPSAKKDISTSVTYLAVSNIPTLLPLMSGRHSALAPSIGFPCPYSGALILQVFWRTFPRLAEEWRYVRTRSVAENSTHDATRFGIL